MRIGCTLWGLLSFFLVMLPGLRGQSVDLPALKIEDSHLAVELLAEEALLVVTEKGSGRVYKQIALPGDSVFSVVPRNSAGDNETRVEGDRIIAVLDGRLDATWTLRLGPEPGDLTSILSADPKALLQEDLIFPHPFDVSVGRDWHVLNISEGVLLPVEDPVIFESERNPIARNEWGSKWGHDLSYKMKDWFGTTDLDSGLAVINRSSFDARISLRLLEDPQRFVASFAWQPSLKCFGYDRELVFHFSPKGGYVALAKRVRRHFMETLPWTTLAEKREKTPHLEKLIGAVDIWIWPDLPYRVEEWKKAGSPREGGEDLLNNAEFVRDLSAAGIKKALLCFVPRDRISSELVSEGDLMGFLPAVYDNYTVYRADRHPAKFWTEALVKKLTVLNEDGSVYESPNRLPNLYYPWILPYAQEEVGQQLAVKPMKLRFYDTLPARPLIEAYQPGIPPSDRRTYAQGKIDFCQMLKKEFGLLLGGENITSFMVPFLDYNEGTMTMAGLTGQSESANKGFIDWPIDPVYTRYGLNEYYRIPLFELVFHDSIVSTWHWRTENHKIESLWWKSDLFNILYGTMPLWNLKPGLWREFRDRFAESYKNVCLSAFEKVGWDEMTDHRWLTEDRMVQQSTFSSGTRIIVNFGETPYRLGPDHSVNGRSFLVLEP